MKQREWIGIADLMSGMMMIFLFIAVAFMLKVKNDQRAVFEIAEDYRQSAARLHTELSRSFAHDLARWKAELTTDNAIVFHAPQTLFRSGSSTISPYFQNILNDFIPRYLAVLHRYGKLIAEVRIEGHTSNEWAGAHDAYERYVNNMRLSQQRALHVLEYGYLKALPAYRRWYVKRVHAVGMAYSEPLLLPDGRIDARRSKRVVFKVVLAADARIGAMLKKMGNDAKE